MRYIRNIIISFCFLAGMQSCLIENDMSYPRTVAEITAFSVEGQKSVNIDAATRTVTVELDELADISAVTVTSSSVTDGAVCDDFPVPGTVLDLTHPKKYVLSIYYDYEWTVSAVQNIDRYVRCDNQLGEASFNLKDREVTVYVSDVQDLTKVMVNEMKLEAEGSEIVSTTGYETSGGSVVEKTVECSFPMELDCLLQRRFTVMDRGETIEWTMSVVSRQVSLAVSSANAWCYQQGLTMWMSMVCRSRHLSREETRPRMVPKGFCQGRHTKSGYVPEMDRALPCHSPQAHLTR